MCWPSTLLAMLAHCRGKGCRASNASTSLAAAGAPNPFSRQFTSEFVIELLGEHLQGNYSTALYGAPGRVPLKDLKLVWLPLLSKDALRAIVEVGGICLLHAKFLFPPFYSPHNPKFDPVGSMWIRFGASYYNHPIPNHSWVEVTHCGAASGRTRDIPLDSDERRAKKFFWDVGPSWYYAAVGSGVSINVGRTIVLGWQVSFGRTIRTACHCLDLAHFATTHSPASVRSPSLERLPPACLK